MSDVWLGQLAPTTADRDATHVAVVPAVAAADMMPGTHCGMVDKTLAGPMGKDSIGIVDPFLTTLVKKGQRFYLCLYPRSVTGLRHHYSHPALDALQNPSESTSWLEQWSSKYGFDTSEVLAHADTWVKTHDNRYGGEYWNEGSRFEGQVVPAEFWDHYDSVRGTKTPAEKRGSFFTCSC